MRTFAVGQVFQSTFAQQVALEHLPPNIDRSAQKAQVSHCKNLNMAFSAMLKVLLLGLLAAATLGNAVKETSSAISIHSAPTSTSTGATPTSLASFKTTSQTPKSRYLATCRTRECPEDSLERNCVITGYYTVDDVICVDLPRWIETAKLKAHEGLAIVKEYVAKCGASFLGLSTANTTTTSDRLPRSELDIKWSKLMDLHHHLEMYPSGPRHQAAVAAIQGYINKTREERYYVVQASSPGSAARKQTIYQALMNRAFNKSADLGNFGFLGISLRRVPMPPLPLGTGVRIESTSAADVGYDAGGYMRKQPPVRYPKQGFVAKYLLWLEKVGVPADQLPIFREEAYKAAPGQQTQQPAFMRHGFEGVRVIPFWDLPDVVRQYLRRSLLNDFFYEGINNVYFMPEAIDCPFFKRIASQARCFEQGDFFDITGW